TLQKSYLTSLKKMISAHDFMILLKLLRVSLIGCPCCLVFKDQCIPNLKFRRISSYNPQKCLLYLKYCITVSCGA
ncbi:hypothetical protein, partial [Desulfosporosinus sp. FKB]|uniref:hypothetical protein n=1 Tax=Desulfosporosinus sp. FKB TaxID=1969835 RepID=UPI001A9A4E01